MERIGELARMICEEVRDARKYAKLALKAKDTSALADARTFAEISNQELGHADKLHDMVVNAIAQAKQTGKEPPEGMERVWDWEHERIIEDTAEVRNLLGMLNA